MKKLLLALPLALLWLMSCKQEEKILIEREITFSIANPAQEGNSGGRTATILEPKSVLVTIKDIDGTTVADRRELTLYKFGESFLSVPLTLKTTGSTRYRLTEFMVMSSENKVAYATPIEGSTLARLVSDPLDIEFVVIKDVITTVTPEVIAINENSNPADYGYGQFGFKVVKTISTVFSAFLKGVNNFELTTAHLKIQGLRDSTSQDTTALWVYEKELEAKANVLTLKEAPRYRITASKPGYALWTKVLTLAAGSATEIIFLDTATWNFSRIWGNNYGTTLNDYGLDIIHTNDGGFIARGSLGSGSSDFPPIPQPSLESMGNALVRVNSNGDVVWTKRLPGINPFVLTRTHAFIKLQDEDAYLIGSGIRYFPGSPFYDENIDGPANSSRAFLLKINGSGEIVWRRHYSDFRKINALFQSPDGSIEAVFNGNNSLSLFSLTHDGEISGNEKWKRENHIGPVSVYKVRSGYIILNGSTAFKLQKQASIVEWEFEYNQDDNYTSDNGLTMVELADGYLLFGTKKYQSVCENLTGERDPVAIKVNENGQILWSRILPLAKNAERVTSAILMPSGNILVGGGSENKNCPPYDYRAFLLEMTSQGEIIGNKLLRASINSGYNTNHAGLITEILSLGQNEYALTGTRQDGFDSDRPRPGYNDMFIMRIRF